MARAPEQKASPAGALPAGDRWVVTRAGDGKIHTGGPPGETYSRGDIVEAPEEQVASLLERGWLDDAPG